MWRTRRERFPWAGPCRDRANRHGRIMVRATGDGRAALIVPADGVAVIDYLTIGDLRDVLWLTARELHLPRTECPEHEVPTTT